MRLRRTGCRGIGSAIELNLFTAVGTDVWTIPDLARDMKVSERGLAILCRNLAMAGLLKKQGKIYRNSRLGYRIERGPSCLSRGLSPADHESLG